MSSHLLAKKAALKSTLAKKAALKSSTLKSSTLKSSALKSSALKSSALKSPALKSSALKSSAIGNANLVWQPPVTPGGHPWQPGPFGGPRPIPLGPPMPSGLPPIPSGPPMPSGLPPIPLGNPMPNGGPYPHVMASAPAHVNGSTVMAKKAAVGVASHGNVQVHLNPHDPSVQLNVPHSDLPGHPDVTATWHPQTHEYGATLQWNFD